MCGRAAAAAIVCSVLLVLFVLPIVCIVFVLFGLPLPVVRCVWLFGAIGCLCVSVCALGWLCALCLFG